MRRLSTPTLSRRLPLPIVLALLFVPLQMASNTAYACSCIPQTVEEQVAAADIVAVGTLVSLYEDESIDAIGLVDMDGIVSVTTYYKGSGPSEIAVNDPPDGGTCGLIGDDSVGREAVMYLELSGDEYLTHLCAGSQIDYGDGFLTQTIAQIEAITGRGQPPDGAPPHDETTEGDASTPWAIILPLAFAIPLAVLVVPALLRRRGGR